MKILKSVLVVVIAGFLVGVVFVYSGVFNVAADEPHSNPFLWLVEKTRERSIAVRAKGIEIPKLEDADLISSGGADYNEMCTGCHLKPGMEDSELRAAMYPQPPDLTKVKRADPAQTFWIIKHGVKMSGMPAWGATHDDRRMWAMVAFLQQLPRLTPEQYQILTARGEEDTDEHSGHGNAADTEESGHSHGDASMPQQPQETKGYSHGEKGQDHQHGEANTKDQEASHDPEKPKANASGHDHSTRSREAAPTASPTAGAPLRASTMEPVAAVDRFFRALASSDIQGASRMLDPAVLIYENGGAERSREDYASHHLGSDATFLKSAQHRLLSRTGDAVGDLAWVATESRLTAQGAKPSDVISTETMVLRKTAEGWRIVHIHWSSRPAAQGS